MIILKCAKCSKQLNADSSLAGETIECPACENVNVVPGVKRKPKSTGTPVIATPVKPDVRVAPVKPDVRVAPVLSVVKKHQPKQGLGDDTDASRQEPDSDVVGASSQIVLFITVFCIIAGSLVWWLISNQ